MVIGDRTETKTDAVSFMSGLLKDRGVTVSDINSTKEDNVVIEDSNSEDVVEKEDVETVEADVDETSNDVEDGADGKDNDVSLENADIVETEGSLKDINDKVKSLLGYDSVSDLLKSETIAKLKEYDALVKERESLKKENEALYVEFGRVNNPFVNKDVYRLNKVLSENEGMSADVALKLITMGDNMDDVQKVILAEKIENPDLSDRQIDRVIAKRFGVEDVNDLYDLDDDDKLDLQISAKKASRTLKNKIGDDIDMPERLLPEEVQKKIDEKIKAKEESVAKLEETWSPVASYLEDNFKEMPIPLFDSKSKESVEYSKYVLTDDDRKRASELLMTFAKSFGISELNKDTIQAANTYVYQSLLAEKLPRLVQIAVDKTKTETIEEIQRERDNPPADKAKDGKKPNLGKQDKRDAFLNLLLGENRRK